MLIEDPKNYIKAIWVASSILFRSMWR